MASCTTGTSASGYMWARTDQVPWSMPQLSWSSPTQRGSATSATSAATSGAPGHGYSNAKSRSGNPKKSWMVRGAAMAVTAVALVYQWAEMARIARGRGSAAPSADHASV